MCIRDSKSSVYRAYGYGKCIDPCLFCEIPGFFRRGICAFIHLGSFQRRTAFRPANVSDLTFNAYSYSMSYLYDLFRYSDVLLHRKGRSVKHHACTAQPYEMCIRDSILFTSPQIQQFLRIYYYKDSSDTVSYTHLIGLCVGHDSMFYKYSDALCTTLVTKDRVLAHNPVGALYQAGAYYSKLLK